MSRYLGIDYGSRRIGLAVSDADGRIAMPAEVVDGHDDAACDAAAVLEAARRHEAECWVVGLPLNMNGSEGPQAARTRRFAEELSRLSGRPVAFQDERLTTAAADTAIRQAGLSPVKHRRHRDKIAAQILLQTHLDARRSGRDA